LAGLHQIYELNLSPKSVKSRLINLRFYGVKSRVIKFALKFNGETIKIYAKHAKTNRKTLNLAKKGANKSPLKRT
jgi:hypothetical protein